MMRAKFQVSEVKVSADANGATVGEQLKFFAVCRSDGYPADGSDEDNTFARWSPSGDLSLYVANPALFGKFKAGDKFYLDFTKAS